MTTRTKPLEQLEFIIANSQGKFNLVFAHCDRDELRDAFLESLRATCQFDAVTIAPEETTLYTPIVNQIKSIPPSAVVVLGLDKVADLDRMLVSANQVRELFQQNFSFPLILWVNDSVAKRLIKVAPDLESWGTSVQIQ